MARPCMRLIVSFVAVLVAAHGTSAEPAVEAADRSESLRVRARMTTEDSFLRTCDPSRSGRYNWPPSQENCPVLQKIPKGSYVTPFCIMPGQPVGTPPNRDPFWVYVEFGAHRGFMPDYFIKCANTPDVCGMFDPSTGTYRLCSGLGPNCCPGFVSRSSSPFDSAEHSTPVITHEWAPL